MWNPVENQVQNKRNMNLGQIYCGESSSSWTPWIYAELPVFELQGAMFYFINPVNSCRARVVPETTVSIISLYLPDCHSAQSMRNSQLMLSPPTSNNLPTLRKITSPSTPWECHLSPPTCSQSTILPQHDVTITSMIYDKKVEDLPSIFFHPLCSIYF